MSEFQQLTILSDKVRERIRLANFIALHPNLAQGRGYLEVKMIKGNEYIYRRWRENGQLKSEYVGKLDD